MPAKYHNNPRQELLPYVPANVKRVLDVGCSDGSFGQPLKIHRKAQVVGIDVDPESVKLATALLDRAIVMDISATVAPLDGQKFDLVCFNDVLEHMTDPYKALRQTHQLLAKDGYVLASIPNIRFFRVLSDLIFNKDFRYQHDGVMDETHLRWFTKKGILRLFTEQGYSIQLIKPINKTKSSRPWFWTLATLGLIGSDIFFPQFVVLAKPMGND